MDKSTEKIYRPGQYGKKRLSAAAWADANIKRWNKQSGTDMPASQPGHMFPCVCFSRQIGVGALKIADILSEKIGSQVVDREILEHMAKEKNLSEKAVAYFDERYPGIMSELFTMLISDKTFLKSDYARQLAKTVIALAGNGPTIFVGRGTHLILPRDKVLSVRIIAGKEYRIERLAKLLNITRSEAQAQIKTVDKEQDLFFKTVYNQSGRKPEEFDLVINRKYLKEASQAAEIVACAFAQKFDADV